MSTRLSIQELPIEGRTILMRVDFNVPLNADGKITDDTRIRAALPSIKWVTSHGGRLILMSHLGRPKGEKKPEFSLAPVARELAAILNRPVEFTKDCIGPEVSAAADKLQNGEILLLENLRFHKAEEKPGDDPQFAQQLADLADAYVNDAFGTAHRAHSSTVSVANLFPGQAAAGFLVAKELQFLGQLLNNPKRPFFSMIGGAKVSSKIGVLKSLIDKSDGILIGGGMTFTFLKAQGLSVGDSVFEADQVDTAKDILDYARLKQVPFLLPVDTIAADAFCNDANIKIVTSQEGIPKGFMGLDIGPKSVQNAIEMLSKAATVLWNGPFGVFELPAFATGTNRLAETLASLPGTTIIGGGDSVAAVNQLGIADQMTHISTGGGATLEYIEFGRLPGIDALSEAEERVT